LADFENALEDDFHFWWVVGERWLGAARGHGGALSMLIAGFEVDQ
jgi:hypothetical protein